jgi:nucleoside-diphosphate-sugar epimerase
MNVFVTGATGFTGSRLTPLLLKSGYSVRCLYRPSSDRPVLPPGEIDWVQGDVSNAEALSSSMRGADIIINVVSLGFGHADSIVRAAKEAGIRRAVFLSTTAIFTQLDAKSKSIRIDAEHSIQASGLDYTILRPSMIYGSPRDRNMWRLIRFMRYSPMIPILGDGNSLQQPIYVDDVAQAVVQCLAVEKTIGRCYNIAGEQALTYNRVIDTIAAQMNKRIWKLHIPYVPVVRLMKFFERFHIPLPIKAEQVLRLNENKAFRYEKAGTDFGFRPLSFEEGIRLEIQGRNQ